MAKAWSSACMIDNPPARNRNRAPLPPRPERHRGYRPAPPFGPCDGARTRDKARGPAAAPCGATDWRGLANVCLPIPIAAFRAQGSLSQLSASSGRCARKKAVALDAARW
jgi:hypothetical protein